WGFRSRWGRNRRSATEWPAHGNRALTRGDVCGKVRWIPWLPGEVPRMIRKVLVPLDGSQLSEEALPVATALAGRTGASIVLVRATDDHSVFGDVASVQCRVIADAESYLADVAEWLAADGVEVECAAPFGGSPADWIVEETEMRRADLVIMATH